MKKFLKANVMCALVTITLVSMLFTGCTKTSDVPDAEKTGTTSTTSELKKVGILQYVEHHALDASRDGFIKALSDNGFVDGQNIKLDVQNAQADQSNLKTISQRFVQNKYDLILAIATPAAQSVASETKDIPILITAVTDAQQAGLVEKNEKPNTNVTGTSDIAPIEAQFDLMMKLLPNVKTVGVMYNSSEVNSKIQADIAIAYADKLGLKHEIGTVTSTNDVAQVTESVASKVDALYIPTDNTFASAIATVVKVANDKKVPIIGSEEGEVTGGALATVGIDYYKLGYKTGEMACDILNGKSKPQDMPIQTATNNDQVIINKSAFTTLGITIPADILSKAKIVE